MRRPNDFYPTPAWATEVLLDVLDLPSTNISFFECCDGDADISNVIRARWPRVVWTNDIAPMSIDQHYQLDAGDEANWIKHWSGRVGHDWVITNPPFNQAAKIVPLAHKYAQRGIAMLLRLSFLEPVEDRGAWLNANPPTGMIVLPRISFTGNGKTDSVTFAWMVWDKRECGFKSITVAENPKFATKQERLIA